MPLSDDQRALLQLLVARGKSPDEIASILAIEPAEVRSRMVDALGVLAPGEDRIPDEVALLLVGQADPMTRADAVTILEADPDLKERTDRAGEELEREFPKEVADAPAKRVGASVGVAEQRRRGRNGGASDQESTRPETAEAPVVAGEDEGLDGRQGMDPGQRRLLSIVVSAAGLIAIVVLVSLLLGGNDDDPTTVTEPTEARLAPVDGQTGSGDVEFGFAGTEFAANISVTGVEESSRGESYAVWLDGPVGAFPFERAKAGPQGVIAGQSAINQAIICFIAADLFTDVKLSRAADGKFSRALREAVSVRGGEGPFPRFVGETVLEGSISMPEETRETLVRECGGRASAGGSRGS